MNSIMHKICIIESKEGGKGNRKLRTNAAKITYIEINSCKKNKAVCYKKVLNQGMMRRKSYIENQENKYSWALM